MSKYSCPLCAKTFSQKIDFTRHTNKKAPCISVEEIQNRVQATVQATVKTNDAKSALIQVLRNCLDIMRDGGGLTGEKALRNLAYLMVLKLLEPRMDEIGIDTHDYEWSVEDHLVENHKKKLLSIVRFRNLSTEPVDSIQTNLTFLWEDVLSQHPATAKIFLKGKGFDIRNKNTYKKLIDKLAEVDLSQCDALGEAYEEVIKDIMTGKVLGQFFTNPLIRKKMVKIVNPQVHLDGTIETCCDPTMGTGGFLTSYLADVYEKAKTQNVTLDWDFITNEGVYGKELEPDTYQLAMSNMLIYSGKMFDKLDCGDSIREPISRKFDIILANPPFGIKGLKYDEFVSDMKSQYLPIKTDNAVSLFIQAIICMLKVGGRCAVVLPDGQDLFSKTGAYVLIREYLMKTCDLKEVYYLPSAVFTNTSIKTCVVYFVKKREGTDVLEVKIKTNANQKETGRDYKFSKTHQTTKVKFYDCNPYEEVDNLLTEVHIEQIAGNAYSMNYAEYMKGDEVEEEYEEDVVMKTLGDICSFLPKSKRNAKYGNKEGVYPFFKSSIKVDSYVDEPDYKEESLIIGDGGEPNINYGVKFSTSDHCYILQNKNKLLLNLKYAYYYLYHNLDMMNRLYTGVAIKNISKTNIEKIKIPIPTLEKQQEIVSYLDFIYEKSNKTSKEKIAELKQLNAFCLKHQRVFGDNVVRTMGEVCKVNQGTYIKPDMKIPGEYPVYGGGNASYYINQYNREDEIIVAKDGVSADCVRYEQNKFFLNHHGWSLVCKEKIIKKYMFYYLQSIQSELLGIAKGTAQLGINQENFYKIKIPIPSLERQQEIVAYCERNEALIRDLETEIEQNKQMASQFLSSVLHITQNEEDEDHDEDETPSDEYENSQEEEPSPISPTIVRSGEKKTIRISKKSP